MSLQRAALLANFDRDMSDYMEDVGRRMREARDRLGITQKEAADRVPITEKQYYRWEKGKNHPQNRETWEAIAKALETTLDELRGEMPEVLDPESDFRAQIDRLEEKLDYLIAAVTSGAVLPPLPEALRPSAPSRPRKPPKPARSAKKRAVPRHTAS